MGGCKCHRAAVTHHKGNGPKSLGPRGKGPQPEQGIRRTGLSHRDLSLHVGRGEFFLCSLTHKHKLTFYPLFLRGIGVICGSGREGGVKRGAHPEGHPPIVPGEGVETVQLRFESQRGKMRGHPLNSLSITLCPGHPATNILRQIPVHCKHLPGIYRIQYRLFLLVCHYGDLLGILCVFDQSFALSFLTISATLEPNSTHTFFRSSSGEPMDKGP